MNLVVSQIVSLVLRGRHAGDASLAINDPVLAVLPRTVTLRSRAFVHRGALAVAQAGRGIGENRSPDLAWGALPPATTHWLLLLEDPDVPVKKAWVHAVVAGPGAIHRLPTGALRPSRAPQGLRFGRNTEGDRGYGGPRPLPGHGPHRYVFQLFAVRIAPADELLAAGRDAVVGFLRDHALACGRLDGVFQRDWRGRVVAPAGAVRRLRKSSRAGRPSTVR